MTELRGADARHPLSRPSWRRRPATDGLAGRWAVRGGQRACVSPGVSGSVGAVRARALASASKLAAPVGGDLPTQAAQDSRLLCGHRPRCPISPWQRLGVATVTFPRVSGSVLADPRGHSGLICQLQFGLLRRQMSPLGRIVLGTRSMPRYAWWLTESAGSMRGANSRVPGTSAAGDGRLSTMKMREF